MKMLYLLNNLHNIPLKQKRNTMDIIFVCSECGSENIMERDWVNPNTGIGLGEAANEIEDRWCNDCDRHVDFETQSEYLNKNKFS